MLQQELDSVAHQLGGATVVVGETCAAYLGAEAVASKFAASTQKATVCSSNKVTVNSNPLSNIQYTDKVLNQATLDDFHGFPECADAFGADGVVTKITGGDGIVRTKVEISGSYKGKDGVFQYIIEPDGVTCNHRCFVSNEMKGE